MKLPTILRPVPRRAVLLALLAFVRLSAAERYLFLDPALLAVTDHAELKVNPASRRETVIVPDRPWERHLISFFLTVRDEEGKLRLWYVCRDAWGDGSQANLAYAESTDGVHWTKPALGITAYHDVKDTNLVGVRSLEGVVFQDPNMPPAERYIYVSTGHSDDGKHEIGLYRYSSPDGLHWRRDAQPVITAGSDTQNVVWWDEHRKEYVVIVRIWQGAPHRVRKVGRLALTTLQETAAVERDGSGWSHYFGREIPTVLACDECDPDRTDIYNLAAQPYPLDTRWYVGFPTFLRRSEKTWVPDWKGRHMGPAEVQFVGSRDSIAWHRYDRAAYAAPGSADPAKKNMTFMGTGMVVRGDEIWQYGTEFETVHGDVEARNRKGDGVIVRYVQRVDGFVSLDTGNEAGTARTVPVRVTGHRLLLNLDTGALGELRVGLRDTSGGEIPGFELERCDALEFNGTGVAVTWADRSDLAALAGREVVLEFRSTRTKLYSFRFE